MSQNKKTGLERYIEHLKNGPDYMGMATRFINKTESDKDFEYYVSMILENTYDFQDKLEATRDTLCHLENATDSHSIQRHDVWNKMINETLQKTRIEV